MKPLLEAKDVSKRFGRHQVLDEVSLELPRGTVTVLLGPNGAGKSTFLSMALGLLKPDRGVVRVDGLDPVKEGQEVHRITGYVPDRPDAPKWMTPRELYRFVGRQYPLWSHEVVGRLTESFQLPLDTPLGRLSRGQGMKAMLVAALAQKPRLLLMDEPFSGIDPVARNEIVQGFLQEIDLEDGAVLVATHDLLVAARLADRVAVLRSGQVKCVGSVEEMLGGSASPVPQGLYELLEEREQRGVAA